MIGPAQPRTGNPTAGLLAALVTLLVWPVVAAAQSVPGPHPFWALVRPDSGVEPVAARTLLRDSLIAALAATDIAPAGYPRPCTIMREPDPERAPGWFLVSCVDPAAGAEADGILLGPDNHYLALEVVGYPSARAFLLEVYLVPRLDYAPLTTDARYELPRVVVFHPNISAEWHPAIWQAIEQGVAATGARRISPEGEP
jgi:hypothetical protein